MKRSLESGQNTSLRFGQLSSEDKPDTSKAGSTRTSLRSSGNELSNSSTFNSVTKAPSEAMKATFEEEAAAVMTTFQWKNSAKAKGRNRLSAISKDKLQQNFFSISPDDTSSLLGSDEFLSSSSFHSSKSSSSAAFVGRESEFQILTDSFDRMRNPLNKAASMVLIGGTGGAGKTTLALQLGTHIRSHSRRGSQLQSNDDVFFIYGKFDLRQGQSLSMASALIPTPGTIRPSMELPFLGVQQAMVQLCNQILLLPREDRKAKKKKMSNSKHQNDHNYYHSEGTTRTRLSPSRTTRHQQELDEQTNTSEGEEKTLKGLQRKLVDGLDAHEIDLLLTVVPNLVEVIPLEAIEEEKVEETVCNSEILPTSRGCISIAIGDSHRSNASGKRPPRLSYTARAVSDATSKVLGARERKSIAMRTSATSYSGQFVPVESLTLSSDAEPDTAVEPSAIRTQHVSIMRSPTGNYRERSDQLRFAFQRLIQIVSNFRHIVWVCDDLQWADNASMDLIKRCLLDSKIASFMVIGCHRIEDVAEDKSDLLSKTIKEIEDMKRKRDFHLAKISLRNLTLGEINRMLADALSDDEPNTMKLAETVYMKTHGNPFFTRQFLLSLIEQNLLRFNIGTLKWDWAAMDDIQANTIATTNVVNLMKTKMNVLDVPVRRILSLGACLGSSFSLSTLRLVLDGLQDMPEALNFYKSSLEIGDDSSEMSGSSELMPQLSERRLVLSQALQLCVQEGLLRKTSLPSKPIEANSNAGDNNDQKRSGDDKDDGSLLYTFIHDKIQEAAMQLIPEDKITELQFWIGEVLFANFDGEELIENCFLVAGLINVRVDLATAATYPIEKRWELVRLNYLSGCLAVELSAFRSAFTFFETGINLLPQNHWKVEEDLSIQLYSSAAECAYTNGDYDVMRNYCDHITNKNRIPILDTIRVYHVLMDAVLGHSPTKTKVECVDLGLKLLRELGCPLPTNAIALNLATIRGLWKAKSDARNWTAEVIDQIPISTDPRHMAIIKTLDKLSSSTYIYKPELLALVIIRNVYFSFESGITEYSPAAVAYLGVIVTYFLGDIQAGKEFGSIALRLQEKLNSPASKSRTTFLAYGLVIHWTQPYELCLGPFIAGHRMGMSVGDSESAMWCAGYYSDMAFCVGTPLPVLESETSTFTKMCEDFGQRNQRANTSIIHQIALNFQGKSDHTVEITGISFREKAVLAVLTETRNRVFKAAIYRFKTVVATFFGCFEDAAAWAVKYCDQVLKNLPAQTSCVSMTFYGGIACYAAVQLQSPRPKKGFACCDGDTEIRQYMNRAEKCRKKLHEWFNKGNVNCAHMVAFLDAESYACAGRQDLALTFYKRAVLLSGRRGRIHDQALANERMGDYCLRFNIDRDEGFYRFGEAKRLYGEWGAHAKVKLLEEQCSTLYDTLTTDRSNYSTI